MASNSITDSFAFANPGSAFYGAIQGLGIDPTHSYLGSAMRRKGSLLAPLLNLSTFGPGNAESQAVPFAKNFAAGLVGRGPNLLDDTNISSLISRFTDAGRDSPEYGVLRTGDLAKDYEAWQSMRDLELANANPLYAQARRGLDERTFAGTAADFAMGTLPDNMTFLDRLLGRAPTAPPPVTPAPATPAPATPAPVTPAPVTPAPVTPTDPIVSKPTPVSAQPTPERPLTINSLQALIDRFKPDQRNWGTEGFRPSVPIDIQIGNERFRYDGAQDQVRDWLNMSGSGRTTHRGNFLGQMLYYLNLLMNQRAGNGNQALGITGATTDADILRIAQERMGRNAVGSTGWTYNRT